MIEIGNQLSMPNQSYHHNGMLNSTLIGQTVAAFNGAFQPMTAEEIMKKKRNPLLFPVLFF